MPNHRFTARLAAYVMLLRDDEILLMRRFNTGYADGQYSLPAGHLDGNEPVIDASIREAREEIGVEIDSSSARVVGVMHRHSDQEYVDFFVAAESWRGEIRIVEPQKCDELRWVPLHDLPGNLLPYVRCAIELTGDGTWFESFGWDD